MDSHDRQPHARVRKIDWRKVTEIADATPGQPFFIGICDQSVRTHFRMGRYAYIDPSLYEIWTEKVEGTTARLFIRRKP